MEIEEAVSAIKEELASVTECETVELISSAGRILGEDAKAGISVPSFPKSAMDGYAVRSEDIALASSDAPVKLEVIGCLFAGDSIPSELAAGLPPQSAVRIMTGAAVPSGYDTVVKQEDTDYGEKTVSINKSQKAYVNYCKKGEDIKEGTLVLSRGSLIGRTEAGVLASIGKSSINVLRKLRIFVISTGSEIIDVGSKLTDSGVYNNVTYMIRASLHSGAFDVSSCIVPDDKDTIEGAIKEALKTSDIVITTGGVSVGTRDLIPDVLGRIGAKKVFSGVNIKPGSPTIGSVAEGKAILSLSGNPYAAIANFDLYIGHIIHALTGCSSFLPVRFTSVLRSEFSKPSNVRRLIRAHVGPEGVTILTNNQASSIMSSYAGANCYIDFPVGSSYAVGDEVNVIRIPEVLL